MTKQEIDTTFGKVQETLDSIRDEDATYMFIGSGGNHFVISGTASDLEVQILFSMMRYPIVKEIIMNCAIKYAAANEKYGEVARNVKMSHLIEEVKEVPCKEEKDIPIGEVKQGL